MVASRQMFGLLLAPILIACLAKEAPMTGHEVELPEEATPATVIQSKEGAIEAFKADLKSVVTDQSFQPVIAIFAMALGVAALWDGKHTFRLIVSICVGAVVFTIVLSQLDPTWTGHVAIFAKYFASLQVACFVAYSAYKGWDGMQLLLGLCAGLYLYHSVNALAKELPYVDKCSSHAAWIIVLGTLCVAFGTWALHADYGAGRVLGIVCPLFGASLVVATFSYLCMLCATMPKSQKALGVVVKPEDVPSVFEFWYMIVYPLHSQAVGYFHFAGKFININGQQYDIDRVLGVFMWIVIALPSICLQLKADRKARKGETVAPKNTEGDLKESLLEKGGKIIDVKK